MEIHLINVEVAYAKPETQFLLRVVVKVGSTLEEVIHQSGICNRFPEINLAEQKVGVFSELRSLTDLAKEGDRIEIYRPLLIDPKEARRKKSEKKNLPVVQV